MKLFRKKEKKRLLEKAKLWLVLHGINQYDKVKCLSCKSVGCQYVDDRSFCKDPGLRVLATKEELFPLAISNNGGDDENKKDKCPPICLSWLKEKENKINK